MIKYFIILSVFILIISIYYLTKKMPSIYSLYIKFFLLILLAILVFLFLSINNVNTEKKYMPPAFDGEKIVPGYFYEKN